MGVRSVLRLETWKLMNVHIAEPIAVIPPKQYLNGG